MRTPHHCDKNDKISKLKQQTQWFNINDYDICKNFNLARWAINIKLRRNTAFYIQKTLKMQKNKEANKTVIESFFKTIMEQFLSDRKKLLTEEGLKEALKTEILAFETMSVSPSRLKHQIIRALDRWDIGTLHNLFTVNKIKKNASQKEIRNHYFQPLDQEYIWVNLSADKKTLLKNFEKHIDLNKKKLQKSHKKQIYLNIIPDDFNNIKRKSFSTKLCESFILPYYDLKLFFRIKNIEPSFTDTTFINEYLPKNSGFDSEALKRTKNFISVLIEEEGESFFLAFVDQSQNEL